MHPNEELIRKGYDAFVRGDIEGVAGFLHPDVVWHVGGTSPLSGVYKGHGELMELFGRLAEFTGGSIAVSARDILASEDHVIVLTRITGKRGDRILEDDGVAVFKVADGKATEVWVFAENQGAIDSFFAG
ncbi:MAG: nuclear transport factor 2 family protein [Actinomycetota bacterium]